MMVFKTPSSRQGRRPVMQDGDRMRCSAMLMDSQGGQYNLTTDSIGDSERVAKHSQRTLEVSRLHLRWREPSLPKIECDCFGPLWYIDLVQARFPRERGCYEQH